MLLSGNISETAAVTQQTADQPILTVANPVDIIKAGILKKYIEDLAPKAMNTGIRIVIAIILFIIGIWIIRLIRKVVRKAMTKANAEVGVRQFVDSFINAALFVLLILLIAIQCGVDAASIVAIIGSAGVAVSLAVQGSLSNLIGGVLILILKPFTVGDYIVDSASGKEGVVTEIKIFHTKLRTVDNQIVILPNGSLANNVITNVTKEDTRRIDIKVGISYTADMEKAKTVLTSMLEADGSVLKDKEHRVVVNKLGESSVELIVRFWVKTGDYWDAYYRLTENTKRTLDSNGIPIPFPQMDVHIVSK